MLSLNLIGALLILCGVVYMAAAALNRGRMSDPHRNPEDTTDTTLEPRHRGLGFLGLTANWPGLALAVLGGIMLLLPLWLGAPVP
jgi:hypothetical protein